MISIDYDTLMDEVICILKREKSIVLATSFENKVTARTMSHVNSGLTIYFQTGGDSEKAEQIRNNPQIAFAAANMQIEAAAEICSQPENVEAFLEMYKVKFPEYFKMYSSIPNEIVVKASPSKITLYKYIDGKPCKDLLDVLNETAFRES